MANPFRKTRQFYHETIGELKKTVWPTRTELRNSTIVVIITMFLLGGFTVVADFSVYSWVQMLTKLVTRQ
ncbi:MAG: preprotein translocase subunit SecE [Opitutales bacterium]|nr:preprotein translocase subunit SecE [Opitutales bacterium]